MRVRAESQNPRMLLPSASVSRFRPLFDFVRNDLSHLSDMPARQVPEPKESSRMPFGFATAVAVSFRFKSGAIRSNPGGARKWSPRLPITISPALRCWPLRTPKQTLSNLESGHRGGCPHVRGGGPHARREQRPGHRLYQVTTPVASSHLRVTGSLSLRRQYSRFSERP
jgi:hypothetical protein